MSYFVISKYAGKTSNAYVKGVFGNLATAEEHRKNLPPCKHVKYHIIKTKDLKKFEKLYECITYA